MGKLEIIDGLINQRVLSGGPAKIWREWLAKLDAEVWDRQLKLMSRGGKLDALAANALWDGGQKPGPAWAPSR